MKCERADWLDAITHDESSEGDVIGWDGVQLRPESGLMSQALTLSIGRIRLRECESDHNNNKMGGNQQVNRVVS